MNTKFDDLFFQLLCIFALVLITCGGGGLLGGLAAYLLTDAGFFDLDISRSAILGIFIGLLFLIILFIDSYVAERTESESTE
ncbi:hypothetical protein [Acinetobacter baumannii]|uniref:hypothetical protein n=1 Tax=Acinetobacter baumannii TaxID=470 RepID=UPI000DF203E6|nr:hypothetical protein [Acinetobacter baumannii]RCT89684.1 hypothetical protein DVA68_15915 [Acinetobacter baumannii]